MTAIELKSELYRQIDTISDNEPLMTKVLAFIRGLVLMPPSVPVASYTVEELNARIEDSLMDIKEGRVKRNEDIEKMLEEEFEWLR
jgi:hypothetical protein